jgi:GGDEF domain-containing protein
MVVCNIFKHSPVFRVGGDEFTAILRGSDYDARDELMHRLEKTNEINRRTGEVTVAGGLAVWDPETEHYLADVFARADAAMYDDKKRYKGLGASGRDAGTEN